MELIRVPMNKVTPFYYASLLLTAFALGLFLFEITYENDTMILVILVAVSMILAFIDYLKAYYRAREMLNIE